MQRRLPASELHRTPPGKHESAHNTSRCTQARSYLVTGQGFPALMSLIGAREGSGSLCIPSRGDAPPGFKVAVAEVVLVQHEPFKSQLPLQASARGSKHDGEVSSVHCLPTKALEKRIFALFRRNQSVAKASLAPTAVRVREVSPNPAQETDR